MYIYESVGVGEAQHRECCAGVRVRVRVCVCVHLCACMRVCAYMYSECVGAEEVGEA